MIATRGGAKAPNLPSIITYFVSLVNMKKVLRILKLAGLVIFLVYAVGLAITQIQEVMI